MNKMTAVIVSASFLISSALFAHGESTDNHMGDHMHNGKMTNHANPDGMTDAEMNKLKNNSHVGDHMHNGKMTNHANSNGMTDDQMKAKN